MEKEQTFPQCPFLGEVVMEYCEAYPIRKPIPRHQNSPTSLCNGNRHKECPFFIEVMARMRQCAAEARMALAGRRSSEGGEIK